MNTCDQRRYENYPMRFVALSNALSVSIYLIGAFVFWTLAPIISICYLIYCVILEIRILRRSCVDCYYYGRTCCFGKGRLSSFLFRRGEPKRFIQKQIRWFDILPDFMVTIFPVVGGITSLMIDFHWLVLVSTVALLCLGFFGSALVRGSFACKYCRQRDFGCPALSLFEKRRT